MEEDGSKKDNITIEAKMRRKFLFMGPHFMNVVF